jgi:hypothetical protein
MCTIFLWNRHRTCFSIKLNHLAPKDDNNHCGSVMQRKCIDRHICRPLTCKGMDGTFKFRYLHGTLCIELWCRNVNNIPDILYPDNSILQCHKVMLLTVTDQIIIILLCQSVSA